jgi:RNA polymerase sigma-70 factor (ECF subfamily)
MNPEKKGRDEILMEFLKNRDEVSLEMLYERYSRLVYSTVFRIVGSVSDAEEVTQEVFLRVWKNAGKFDPSKGSALAWLMAITRRLAIDRTRSKHFKSQKSEVNLAAVNVEESQRGKHEGAEIVMIKTEEARIMLDALNNLPEQHRRMIDLAYYEGLSHSKIASRLNMPLGTVKTMIRKAVIDLRSMLNGKL